MMTPIATAFLFGSGAVHSVPSVEVASSAGDVMREILDLQRAVEDGLVAAVLRDRGKAELTRRVERARDARADDDHLLDADVRSPLSSETMVQAAQARAAENRRREDRGPKSMACIHRRD